MRFRLFVFMIVCITGYSSASWLCPVYRAGSSGLVEDDSSDNLATLSSWYVTIQPTHLENEVMSDYAYWDYIVSERLTFLPPASGCDILICLDLGVVPETVRKLGVFWVNAEEMEQLSMLGSYPIDPHNPDQLYNLPADSLFYIYRFNRENGSVIMHRLSPARIFRARFESEEDFRSAVPETRRFYADMWEIHTDGEEITVSIVYHVRGWTYLTGAEPLLFSLCQPLLWNGPIGEGRIVFECPWTMDTDEWHLEFDEQKLPFEGFCAEVKFTDFNPSGDDSIPFLLVIPPSS